MSGAEIASINDVIIHGVCHLARGKAAPDQAIKAILLGSQIRCAQRSGAKLYIGRTDGFVRVLRAGLWS